MSYDIFDSAGFIASGPSIGGLRDLEFALTSKRISPAVYPQVANFFAHGIANSPLRFKLECMALSKHLTDPMIKKTLIELGKAAAKCKTIVILH